MIYYKDVKLTGYEVGMIIMSLEETLKEYERQLEQKEIINKNVIKVVELEIRKIKQLIENLDNLDN